VKNYRSLLIVQSNLAPVSYDNLCESLYSTNWSICEIQFAIYLKIKIYKNTVYFLELLLTECLMLAVFVWDYEPNI
jgi:hypothetical protein